MVTDQDLKREDMRESLLIIYENFYWIHLWIITVCARWILKRGDVEGKLELVEQAWEERNQMHIFKQGILDLGYDWDALDHDAYLFDAMRDRYHEFMTTDDELEVLIGMNLYSEGVFGCAELEELYNHSPDLFSRFPEFLQEEIEHAEQGRKVLMGLLEKQPDLRPRAQELVKKYQNVLIETTTDAQFGPFLKRLIEQGFIGADIVDGTQVRFKKVFGDLMA